MATHLMGHPFAQAFIANEQAIKVLIATLLLKSQIIYSQLLRFISTKVVFQEKLLGCKCGLLCLNIGIKNTILQRIYEHF